MSFALAYGCTPLDAYRAYNLVSKAPYVTSLTVVSGSIFYVNYDGPSEVKNS